MSTKHAQKEAHQQKRLRERRRRIPPANMLSERIHSDRIDEAAAPTKQKLPEIGERRRLTERIIPIPRNKDVPLAVWVCIY